MSANKFSNDGSFMDKFRERMANNDLPPSNEQTENYRKRTIDATDEDDSTARKKAPILSNPNVKKSAGSAVGKRRKPTLKTGAVVKKPNPNIPDDDTLLSVEHILQDPASKTDPLNRYLAEVDKYKFQACQDEDKTRPLVK